MNKSWWSEFVANCARSKTVVIGWAYVGFGAVYDYLPAFRAILGKHFATALLATGVLMIVLRIVTHKPVLPTKPGGK